jgi:hypothetical protein
MEMVAGAMRASRISTAGRQVADFIGQGFKQTQCEAGEKSGICLRASVLLRHSRRVGRIEVTRG